MRVTIIMDAQHLSARACEFHAECEVDRDTHYFVASWPFFFGNLEPCEYVERCSEGGARTLVSFVPHATTSFQFFFVSDRCQCAASY